MAGETDPKPLPPGAPSGSPVTSGSVPGGGGGACINLRD
jgi:hypothetical protein